MFGSVPRSSLLSSKLLMLDSDLGRLSTKGGVSEVNLERSLILTSLRGLVSWIGEIRLGWLELDQEVIRLESRSFLSAKVSLLDFVGAHLKACQAWTGLGVMLWPWGWSLVVVLLELNLGLVVVTRLCGVRTFQLGLLSPHGPMLTFV